MPDYSKGKIYTIRCRNDPTLIYVGSTIQPLSHRLGSHKYKASKYPDRWYSIIKDWNDWYIELYESYPCNNKEELVKREGEIIRLIGNLNKVVAGRTIEEYREDNYEMIKERKKLYVEKNKEEVVKREKEWYEKNKEYCAEKRKEWNEKNKEKKKELAKEYYENNKEKLKEYKKLWYEKQKLTK